MWLGPIEYAEFENCFPDTDESVRQALYRLTGGAPLWIEAMWEDWKSRNQVERDRGGSWPKSHPIWGRSVPTLSGKGRAPGQTARPSR